MSLYDEMFVTPKHKQYEYVTAHGRHFLLKRQAVMSLQGRTFCHTKRSNRMSLDGEMFGIKNGKQCAIAWRDSCHSKNKVKLLLKILFHNAQRDLNTLPMVIGPVHSRTISVPREHTGVLP